MRRFLRAFVATLTFAAVLGVRLAPWPGEASLAAGASHVEIAPKVPANESEAAVWLIVAGCVLARVLSKPSPKP